MIAGTLHACLVLSTVAHAKVLSIDASEAKSAKGVIAVFAAEDVPFNIGEMFGDGELFASKEILYYGQPLAVVVANTKKRAERAVKLVKVAYEELPAILTIQDAIAANCNTHIYTHALRYFNALSQCSNVPCHPSV